MQALGECLGQGDDNKDMDIINKVLKVTIARGCLPDLVWSTTFFIYFFMACSLEYKSDMQSLYYECDIQYSAMPTASYHSNLDRCV